MKISRLFFIFSFFLLFVVRTSFSVFYEITDFHNVFYSPNKKYKVAVDNNAKKIFIHWIKEKKVAKINQDIPIEYIFADNRYFGFFFGNSFALYCMESMKLIFVNLQSKIIENILIKNSFFEVQYNDGESDFFKLRSGAKPLTLKNSQYTAAGFSGSGDKAYFLYNNTVQIFHVSKNRLISTLDIDKTKKSIGFLSDSLFVSLCDRGLVFYDIKTGQEKHAISLEKNKVMKRAVFNEKEKRYLIWYEGGHTSLYDESANLLCTMNLRSSEVKKFYLNKNKIAIFVYDDNYMELFHLNLGTRLNGVQLRDRRLGAIKNIIFERKGLFVRYTNDYAEIYDTSNWKCISLFKVQKDKEVRIALPIPGTEFIYVLYYDHTLEVFDLYFKVLYIPLKQNKGFKRVEYLQEKDESFLYILYNDASSDKFCIKELDFNISELFNDNYDINDFIRDISSNKEVEENESEENIQITGKKRKRENDEDEGEKKFHRKKRRKKK